MVSFWYENVKEPPGRGPSIVGWLSDRCNRQTFYVVTLESIEINLMVFGFLQGVLRVMYLKLTTCAQILLVILQWKTLEKDGYNGINALRLGRCLNSTIWIVHTSIVVKRQTMLDEYSKFFICWSICYWLCGRRTWKTNQTPPSVLLLLKFHGFWCY